ncbi:hypothetical protein GCM10027440_41410 [Nocardiopsis coralliicola]
MAAGGAHGNAVKEGFADSLFRSGRTPLRSRCAARVTAVRGAGADETEGSRIPSADSLVFSASDKRNAAAAARPRGAPAGGQVAG